MSFDPRAREVVAEVAGARVDLQEVQAVQGVREATYEDRLNSGRQSLEDIFGDGSGLVVSENVPGLVRASMELEGASSVIASAAGRELTQFQRTSGSGREVLLAIGGDVDNGREMIMAFSDSSKPNATSLSLQSKSSWSPGWYELSVKGGNSSFPVISAKEDDGSAETPASGKYEVATDGQVESIALDDYLSVIGDFSTSEDREASKARQEATLSGKLNNSILFGEAAIEYLDSTYGADQVRRPGGREDILEELPLILIAKGIVGVDLTTSQQRVVEGDAFRGKMLEVISAYAGEITGLSDYEVRRLSRAPAFLHCRVLDLAGIEKIEVEDAVEQGAKDGAKKIGGVLEETELDLISERITAGKRRKIREVAEPAVARASQRLEGGLRATREFTGLSVDPERLVSSAFTSANTFLSLTQPGWERGKDAETIREALWHYAMRARSFRSAS